MDLDFRHRETSLPGFVVVAVSVLFFLLFVCLFVYLFCFNFYFIIFILFCLCHFYLPGSELTCLEETREQSDGISGLCVGMYASADFSSVPGSVVLAECYLSWALLLCFPTVLEM